MYSDCILLVQKIQKTVEKRKSLLHRNVLYLVHLVNRESPLMSTDNEIYINQEPVNLGSYCKIKCHLICQSIFYFKLRSLGLSVTMLPQFYATYSWYLEEYISRAVLWAMFQMLDKALVRQQDKYSSAGILARNFQVDCFSDRNHTFVGL